MISAHMNKHITIEQPTETKNAAGEVIKTWVTFMSMWAEKKDSGSREFMAAGGVVAAGVAFFKVWFVDGITAKMRIKERVNNVDIYYNILGPPKELGNREALEITAEYQDHGYNT